MNRRLCNVVLGVLLVLLAFGPAAFAKDEPVIFASWPYGSLLIVEGAGLSVDGFTEPSKTVNVAAGPESWAEENRVSSCWST